MFRRILLITITSLLLICNSCKKYTTENEVSIAETKRSFIKEGLLHFIKADGTKTKTIDIAIAESDFELETDLKNHEVLTDYQGVLFIYPQSELRGFYMTDIPFPLDLIFLDEENKIVSFSENTKAFDETTFLPSQVPVLSVLKINAGLSEEWLLDVGDRIEIVRFEL